MELTQKKIPVVHFGLNQRKYNFLFFVYKKGNGEGIIKEYSRRLTNELGKGYNTTSLKRMRQFYLIIEKGATLRHLLSWSHYRILITLNDINEINYYILQICKLNLSIRELERRIKNKEYERLDEKTKEKLMSNEEPRVNDLIKNPILIKNSYDYKEISEKILQKLILEDMSNFLDELGSGFCFIRNEYKIKIGERYNYIDLLLFNYIYNCFIVIELKITELKKEHIGQIETYMNYVDKNIRRVDQDKTIGRIICKKDNKFIMEYCSDDRIYQRVYELM